MYAAQLLMGRSGRLHLRTTSRRVRTCTENVEVVAHTMQLRYANCHAHEFFVSGPDQHAQLHVTECLALLLSPSPRTHAHNMGSSKTQWRKSRTDRTWTLNVCSSHFDHRMGPEGDDVGGPLRPMFGMQTTWQYKGGTRDVQIMIRIKQLLCALYCTASEAS